MKNISFDQKLSYLKHDSIKNYFPLPNIIFSLGLKSGEILVYAYLMCRENRETFQCYPSYRKIGEALSISKKTVYKYVKSLEKKQLISTEPTTGKKKKRGLFLKISKENETKIESVKNLLSIFEGDLPVYFYHEETKEYEFLGKDNLIWINDPLKRELTEILGKDNVVVQN